MIIDLPLPAALELQQRLLDESLSDEEVTADLVKRDFSGQHTMIGAWPPRHVPCVEVRLQCGNARRAFIIAKSDHPDPAQTKTCCVLTLDNCHVAKRQYTDNPVGYVYRVFSKARADKALWSREKRASQLIS